MILEIKRVPLSSLVIDPANCRTHGERNMASIKASLQRFGQAEPLVVQKGTNRVIAGHGRLAAMLDLGWTECDIVEVELGSAEATALGIALNRSGELAGWDNDALGSQIRALLDDEAANVKLEHLGFSELDLKALVDGVELPRPDDGGKAAGDKITEQVNALEEDEEVEPPAEPKSRLGDLYLLGKNRLLCGDSMKPETFKRLMGGEKARLLCTDPPYGVDYSKTKDGIPRPGFADHQEQWGDIAGDDLKDKKLQEFLETCFRSALPHLDKAAWYLWHAHLTQGFFAAAAAAAAADVLLHRQIVWKKPGFVLTRSGMYHWAHEPCFYGWVRGQQPQWLGDRSQTSVWDLDRDQDRGYHPTQKPIRLFAIPILNHLREGEIALEPFSGSGSQIIAAQRLKRRCFAVEIDPRYVDAAVMRWERMTGEKAKKE